MQCRRSSLGGREKAGPPLTSLSVCLSRPDRLSSLGLLLTSRSDSHLSLGHNWSAPQYLVVNLYTWRASILTSDASDDLCLPLCTWHASMTRREPHMQLAYPLSLPPALSSAGYLKTFAAVWHLVIGLVLLSSVVWYEGQRRLGQLPFNADWVERQTLYYVYVGIWLATLLGMIVQLLEEHQALYASSNFFAEDVHERFSSRWLNLGTFCVSTASASSCGQPSSSLRPRSATKPPPRAARAAPTKREAGSRRRSSSRGSLGTLHSASSRSSG